MPSLADDTLDALHEDLVGPALVKRKDEAEGGDCSQEPEGLLEKMIEEIEELECEHGEFEGDYDGDEEVFEDEGVDEVG